MKKKCIILLFMALCLSGCANNTKSNEKQIHMTTETATVESTSEENNDTVSDTNTQDLSIVTEEDLTTEEIRKKGKGEDATLVFEKDIILAEDDNFVVKLKGLFQERVSVDNGYIIDKGVIFDVTNKGNYKFIFDLEDIYLDKEGAVFIIKNGNDGPAPGKTREYSFYINRDTVTSDKVLTTLNELSELNGSIEYEIYSDDESYIDLDKSYRVPFSLQDYSEDINSIVNENIDYNFDGFSSDSDDNEGAADLSNFDILGKWFSFRGNVKEEYSIFNEDGTVTHGDGSKCTWELIPDKRCVHLYYPDYDWGGDYAINEYDGYYIIQLQDITFVRSENCDDYMNSIQ